MNDSLKNVPEVEALHELIAELVYALDTLRRRPEMGNHYAEIIAKTKEYVLKHRPDLAHRLYD